MPSRSPRFLRVAFALVALAAGGSACVSAGSATDAPSPPGAVADAVRAELGGPAVALLAEAVRAVEAGDWDAYRGLLDADGLDGAIAFLVDHGVDPVTAVSEATEQALGLGYVSTPVFPDGADRSATPYAGLGRIRTLRFEAVTDRRPAYDQLTVGGRATLDDGSSLPVSATVLRPSGPVPALSVPQG